MIDVMFFQKFLHVCIVKFFSSIGLQIFRTSSTISNYFCDCHSNLISTLGLERYSPCVLAQHVDDREYIVITSIESRVWTHLYHIRLPQIIIPANYDVSSWKISSRRSMQFLHQLSLLGAESLLPHHVYHRDV